MSQAYMSPAVFAYWVAEEGLPTKGGKVRLNRYMSASDSNGGSYTSQDLLAKLRPLMQKTHSEPAFQNYIRIGMGQGYINDFINLWNWMFDHLAEVRTLKVQTYKVEKNKDADGYTKIPGKILDLAQVFRDGRPFTEAMGELVDNGCFGWDCIGFVSQYLITISHINEYPSWKSDQFLTNGKFTPVKSLAEIEPCCVLVFGDWHIVLVNLVDYIQTDDQKGLITAKVSVSQSYTGGPHTRYDRILTQAKSGGSVVTQTGVLDNQAQCIVGKNADINVYYLPSMAD
jgi:hypothetical protein